MNKLLPLRTDLHIEKEQLKKWKISAMLWD